MKGRAHVPGYNYNPPPVRYRSYGTVGTYSTVLAGTVGTTVPTYGTVPTVLWYGTAVRYGMYKLAPQ